MSISGKYLTADINGVTVAGTQAWSVVESSYTLDGATAKHAGYSADVPGMPSAAITLELVQDTRLGEYSSIRRGTRITNLRLFRMQGDPEPAFEFPVAHAMKSENGGRVKERFIVRVEASNFGPYFASDPGAG
jgi:hypothetical protein